MERKESRAFATEMIEDYGHFAITKGVLGDVESGRVIHSGLKDVS